MRSVRYLLAAVLLFGALSNVVAQNDARLIIMPNEVKLEPGQGQRFEAILFGANGQPLRIEKVTWSAAPEELGKISEDGFFIAGRQDGEVKILAKAQSGNAVYAGEAHVIIGKPPVLPVRIIVEPGRAVVPPLGTQQFRALVVTPNANPQPATRVKWQLVPENLGRISETGLFTAGSNAVAGGVIAFVEFNGAVYRGEAWVIVSPAASASIAGSVKDQKSGEPIANAVILAERIGGLPWSQRAQTDDAGNYILENLIPGLYVLRAEARGYLPEFYNERDQFEQATVVQVVENEAKTGIDFTLSHGATISGLVAAESDNMPIAGAHVVAIRILRPDIKHHTVTDENGNYALMALPAGSYAIFAEAAGYKSEFFDNKRELLQADHVDVSDEQNVGDINLLLATSSAISGKVVDATTNDPLAKAVVIIYPLVTDNTRPRVLLTTLTNENGDYIANVPPGFYVVAVEARGYHKEFYEEQREFVKATPVQVFADQHTTGTDFTLDKLAAITGRVTDQATGDPIAGAIITAFPERNAATDPVANVDDLVRPIVGRTDENGNYKLEGLRPGKYFVHAEVRGYLGEFWQEAASLDRAEAVEVPASGNVEGIDFTLEKGGSIAGLVVDAASNAPIGGALIQVWPKGSNAVIARGVTGRDGKYRIVGLRTGDYIVFASAPGYRGHFYQDVESRDQATEVHVEAPNETADIDFHLKKPEPTRGGMIAGTVVSEADQNPIPNAFVLAIPVSAPISNLPPFTFADQFGSYKLAVPAGKYVVVSWAPHYLAEFFENAETFQGAKIIGVENGAVLDHIHFSLKPARRGPYNVTGRVRYKNEDRGAGNFVVQAIEAGAVVGTAVTDNNGNFVLEEMAAGEYQLAATGVTGVSEDAATVTVGAGRNSSNVDLIVPGATAVEEPAVEVPATYDLAQNFPNPFNPETSIKYQVPVRTNVSLRVYNALGQEVRTLVNTLQDAGVYNALWDGKDNNGRQLVTGIYLVRLEAGDFVMTRKMAMVK
ncbi:carboxypeptidase regulatory-like domain-containing protein [candidate division KSB1 bacterium]|nr:carboxypeptidase regulatory-like domain-containing protein [candidate division KSB1 bacterium]